MRVVLAVGVDGDGEGFAEVAFGLTPAAVVGVEVSEVEEDGAGVLALEAVGGFEDGERAAEAAVGVGELIDAPVEETEGVERETDAAVVGTEGGGGDLDGLLGERNGLVDLALLAELLGLRGKLRPARFLGRG